MKDGGDETEAYIDLVLSKTVRERRQDCTPGNLTIPRVQALALRLDFYA